MNGGAHVLLVEDNPNDIELTLHAFRASRISNEIKVLRDGVEALAYLFGDGGEAAELQVILLDLKLPKIDGLEVLKQVRAHDATQLIPVVVLTTSSAEEDILRSYDLHANAYVTKPVDFDRFVAVIQQIDDFFISVVRLPGS